MSEDKGEFSCRWSDEDLAYVARYLDTPTLSGIGDTPNAAIGELLIAYRLAYLSEHAENARLRAVIQQQNRAIRALTEERDAAHARERIAAEAYNQQQQSYRDLEALYQAMTERAQQAETIGRRGASHLPGNPDAAAAVLSGILEGR